MSSLQFSRRKQIMRFEWDHTLFFIRTSNFGAEAERSYIFLRCEAENVLKMFLNLHDIVYSKTIVMLYKICP